MSFISIFLTAVGLAMDAFAVSVSNGILLKQVRMSHILKFGFCFGLFQFIMPILGFLLGSSFSGYIQAFDHWIAFILLGAIGGNMLHESFKGDDNNRTQESDIMSIKNLTMLSVATSIDAMAVGVTFAFLKSDLTIVQAAAVIGLVAFLFSAVGVLIGKRLGGMFEKNAMRIGGLILILIGSKILIEHLFFASV